MINRYLFFKKLFPKYIIFIEKNGKYITFNNENRLNKYAKEGKVNYILVNEKNEIKIFNSSLNRYDEFLIKEYLLNLIEKKYY